MEIPGSAGSGLDVFKSLEGLATTDGQGEGVVTNHDPFELSKAEFKQGAQELGFSESEIQTLWEQIADGDPSISRENFSLSDLKPIDEATAANRALMADFIDIARRQGLSEAGGS